MENVSAGRSFEYEGLCGPQYGKICHIRYTNWPYLIIFLYFNDQISYFFSLKGSRGPQAFAGHVLETPAVYHHKFKFKVLFYLRQLASDLVTRTWAWLREKRRERTKTKRKSIFSSTIYCSSEAILTSLFRIKVFLKLKYQLQLIRKYFFCSEIVWIFIY